MKHALYDPVYVTTEHAFGEVVGWSTGGTQPNKVQVHLYHKPADEVIWVLEKDALEHIGSETEWRA